jgi:hypothetical protein
LPVAGKVVDVVFGDLRSDPLQKVLLGRVTLGNLNLIT